MDYERRLAECQKAIQDRNDKKGLPSDIYKVFRKPEILGIFSQGYDRKFGNTLDFGLGDAPLRLVSYMGKDSLQSQSLSGFSSVDFEFLVRIILSLSAIFLAYDVISGEREAGTLRLTLSNSVKRSTLLLGKFLGGLLSLLIPLILIYLLSLLIASFSPLIDFQSAEYSRVGFIFLLSALYLTSFFTLGMFLSTLTKRSKVTLLISLLIWVFLLFIVPNASFEIAQKIKPAPSSEMIEKQVEAAGFSATGKDWIKYERKVNEIERRLNERIYQQIELSRWLSSFSPAVVYSHTTQIFARTDLSSYRRFMKFIYAERDIYDNNLLERFRLPEKERTKREYEYQKQFKESFQVPRESIEESLNNALPDICLLFLFSFLFYFLAYFFFLKHEV
jgi:ABC-type transport system involved in multi-copper enzyme maturation permease subunit